MADEGKRVMLDEPEPTERKRLFEETHKKSVERVARIDDMMQAVVKAQVAVEGSLIEMLEACGKTRRTTSSRPGRSRRYVILIPESADLCGTCCCKPPMCETNSSIL